MSARFVKELPLKRIKIIGLLLMALAGFVLMGRADPEVSSKTVRPMPDWLRSGIVYEIFPRDFSAAGNLNGVTARLDELNDLGVNILWLMPVHPIGEKMKKGSLGSPYAVRDFYAINPDYGTTNDFKRLIEQAHQRKLKVLMEIVAGQTSWDSVLMTTHPDFFLKDANGAIIPPSPGWTDVAGLDYSNPAVRRYMDDMMKYWLQEFGVDGFRFDVAPNVPVDFWEATRAELEKINPQVIILADAGAKAALLDKAFDVDSSWALYSTVDTVMSGLVPASYVRESWEHTDQQFSPGALHLRFTDMHEKPRAMARYGMNGALAAQVLMLTLDGVPLFYNGMEAGDATESADPALFEKIPIFWQPSGRPPLRDIYRDLNKLRRQSPALCTGDVMWLTNSAPDEVVSFMRQDATNKFLVVINLSNRRVKGSVQWDNPAELAPLKISNLSTSVDAVLPDFQLPGYGWQIYRQTTSK
jgi:cyclomaltodextrinase